MKYLRTTTSLISFLIVLVFMLSFLGVSAFDGDDVIAVVIAELSPTIWHGTGTPPPPTPTMTPLTPTMPPATPTMALATPTANETTATTTQTAKKTTKRTTTTPLTTTSTSESLPETVTTETSSATMTTTTVKNATGSARIMGWIFPILGVIALLAYFTTRKK